MRINSQPTRLLIAVLSCIGLVCLARTQQTPAKDPTDKTAAGVPDTQKLAGTEDDRFAPKLSEAQQQIEAALAKQVTCKYHSMPLSEVVADLARQVELPIDLDDQGLEEAGVDRTTPISLEAGPLSLRAVLTLLEVRHHLGYMPGLGGLRLTTEEIAAEDKNGVVRVYPASDLLAPAKNASEHSETVIDYESLIDLLTNQIDSDSWTDNGGTGSISGFGGSLVVRQTLARHHRIAAALFALRKLPAERSLVARSLDGPTYAALARPISGEAKGDLNDFLTQIGDSLKIPIVVAIDDLESAGLETTAPVQGRYTEQPGLQVLTQLLQPLHLQAAVFPEFVLVTAEDEDDVGLETRFYSAAGLVDLERFETEHIWPYGWMPTALSAVVDLIVSTIEPEHWTDHGGNWAVAELHQPPCVAISAPHSIHLQIEQLLATLRPGAQEQLARERKDDAKIVERSYAIYLARRQLKAQLEAPKVEPPAPAAPAVSPKPAVPAKPAAAEDPFGSNLRRAHHPLAQFGGAGMGGIATVRFSNLQFGEVAEPIPTADDVAKLIRELLPDPSWKEEGVLLRPFHDVLIVRQRGPMLRKIERLLESIDAWHDPRMRGFGPGVCGQIIPVVGDYSEKPRSQ